MRVCERDTTIGRLEADRRGLLNVGYRNGRKRRVCRMGARKER